MTRLRLILRDDRGLPRLGPALVESLIARLSACADNAIVTLENGADSFCEGLDLGMLAETETDIAASLERFADLLDTIEAVPRPVVALVNGPAMGGGVGLAAAADLVIASPRATFGLPECLFGLIPAMVFPVLARRVGHTRSRWLALSARTLTADEAVRIGLVDELAEDPDAALDRHARRFERLDPGAMAAVKSLAATWASGQSGYRQTAAQRFAELLKRPETRDRIARFLDGDTPWPSRGGT
jgi:3-carboxymethyl-3-hydroxy-acyl-[acp] dehydratase